MDEEGSLDLDPALILKAFELAGPYATGKSNTAKLEHRMEVALSLVDWAVRECDRGVKLLELQAELALKRKGDGGGSIVIYGPFGLG